MRNKFKLVFTLILLISSFGLFQESAHAEVNSSTVFLSPGSGANDSVGISYSTSAQVIVSNRGSEPILYFLLIYGNTLDSAIRELKAGESANLTMTGLTNTSHILRLYCKTGTNCSASGSITRK